MKMKQVSADIITEYNILSEYIKYITPVLCPRNLGTVIR